MVSTVRSWLNWLFQQFQLKPGKPAIASSLRALISVLGPLLVGVWLGHPTASAIAIMAAWFVGLVNIEGVYRQKAVAKVAALISIIAMLLLANLVHSIFWLSVLTMFAVMFVAGLVNVFGQAVSSISLITSIMFIVALARFSSFPDWSTVFQQCAIGLAGGTWSIIVSLALWRLHPYKPVIQSVANCYSALSQLVDAAKGRVAYPGDRRAQLTQFLQAQDNFTQS
ncbi:MAG TPA: FUSC family membrane protein, partial [Crinalium sp.]